MSLIQTAIFKANRSPVFDDVNRLIYVDVFLWNETKTIVTTGLSFAEFHNYILYRNVLAGILKNYPQNPLYPLTVTFLAQGLEVNMTFMPYYIYQHIKLQNGHDFDIFL